MLSVIEEVAETWEKDLTRPLTNALGYAVEAYTSWHVRGDDRKAFLQRACDYYRRHLSLDYKRDAVAKLPALPGTESPQISPLEEMAKVVGFDK